MMLKPNAHSFEGNDKFEGFCVDLMEAIAEKTGQSMLTRKIGINKS